MRVSRIRLAGFKCFADADLALDRGVTVIHGLNGSGKSSLLEAAFFALYGAKALETNLDEVVTIGAEECTVELWFRHGGRDFHVKRRVRMRDGGAVTVECVLETPEGPIEGAKDVRGYVVDLLRMDSEAFVNCAYVRQGEVNKLINAAPSERQDMLDDLLQLGKLEEYRERASDARVGVGRVRDDKTGALAELDEQIAAKEEANLHERLNDLESEHNDVVGEIERIEAQRERAVETRDRAQTVLDEHEERREELESVNEDVESLRETVAETEREREELKQRVTELRQQRGDLEADREEARAESDLDDADDAGERIETLEAEDEVLQERIKEASVAAQEHRSGAENARENADDLEERAAAKWAEAEALEAEIADDREAIADRRERLVVIEDDLETQTSRFEDAPVDPDGAEVHHESVQTKLEETRQQVSKLEERVENEREALEDAKALLDAGKCPECGQDVDGSPHVDTIEDDEAALEALESDLEEARETTEELSDRLDRAETLLAAARDLERLETQRENVEQLVSERASTLEDAEETVEELRTDAEALEAEADEKRATVETAEEAAEAQREIVAECNEKRQAIREQIDRFERIESIGDEIDAVDDEIERLSDKRASKAELNDERRERLAEKRERRDELREAVDEARVEEAETQLEKATEYIENADAELDTLREQRSDLQEKIGGVRNEIEELEELRERRDGVATTVERLESLYAETRELQETYGQLRAELRQRNVETLERMLNETFALIYQNDAYSHIELDGEYRLTVYQKDGEALDPEQLSGGERALFNLSLRVAIYRLLAEGIEGAAPMPPLILDEPTVFLDSGHVTQLLDLVEFVRDDVGVEQILVVSHDDELVGAADDLVRVEKDSTTNRSAVERVEHGALVELAD